MHRLEQDKIYKHFIERTRIGNLHRWILYLTTGVIWLSGLIWILFHYFGVHHTDAGEIHSSMEPLAMKIHGAAAMAFMIVIGSLIPVHVRRGLALKRNLFSGIFLIANCAVLIMTGWVLYYLGTEQIRNVVSLIHWILGLALPLLIYLHILAWKREQSGQQKILK